MLANLRLGLIEACQKWFVGEHIDVYKEKEAEMKPFKCNCNDGGEVKQVGSGVWEWECSHCGLRYGLKIEPSVDFGLNFVRLATSWPQQTPQRSQCPACNEELLAGIHWLGFLVWACGHCGRYGVAASFEGTERDLTLLDEPDLFSFFGAGAEIGRYIK